MTTFRVLFLTNDREYGHRLSRYFAKYHPEIKPAFRALNQDALDELGKKMYNVVLIDEELSADTISLPSGVSGAYISENSSESEINGLSSFCKYKSGETLYRILVNMFADVSNTKQTETRGNKVFAFIGASGGAGASTMAAAFAYRQSSLGKKTLYFCCDQLADYTGFLSDNTEGGSLSDLIFMVKSASPTGNTALKAAALLKKDVSGVRFLENCSDPSDLDNLTAEQINKMLDIISGADEFDCVIIDASFYDERCRKLIMKKADTIFIVAESGDNSKAKLRRLIHYLNVTDKRGDTDLSARSMLILNKGADSDPSIAGSVEIAYCGGVPRYKDTNARNIVNAASRLVIWNSIDKH